MKMPTVTVKVTPGTAKMPPGARPAPAVTRSAPPGQPGKSAGAVSRSLAGQGAGPSTAPDPSSAPPSGPGRRARHTPLTPMRQDTAKSIRKLAASAHESHPDLSVHQHLRDAARVLESGNEEGAERHLRAAAFALTPQSLMRNGLHTDDHHQSARSVVHGVHRQLLLVKDIMDVAARNQANIERASYGDPAAPPGHGDPNAGYGPGALAQRPTARQPGGDKAMNAPAQVTAGKPDPNVADPVGPQPKGSKQFAYGWDDLADVIDSGPAVELSAETPRLAVTPAPRGKPGGPGLYGVKGSMHSPYMQNIVKALIEKRGMDPGRAYAVAWGAMRKWARGGGKVHPEVRAAAAGGLGLEKAAEARAHAHSVSRPGLELAWGDLGAVIERAVTPE